ncbi:MAG TPA: condensation domain-containing protein [Caulobacteraceae bacterium]|jgi:hypothetical protein|nr:condensation domain-containing protein [Caulobacteraceae bacterium]
MPSAAEGSPAAGGGPAPSDPSTLEAFARRAAAEPFRALADRPPTAAAIQRMWWGWVHGHPVQLPHERLYLFVRFEDVDPLAAEAAVRATIARHDTLRSRFAEQDGGLQAWVNPAEDFRVDLVRLDVTEDLDAAIEAERVRFTVPELRIDGDWLARARVVAGGSSLLVCLVFHHMVFDARSRLLLEQELLLRLAPGTDPARDLGRPAQYLDYAAWERDWLEREGAALCAYWRAWLASVPPLRNPRGGVLAWRPGHKAYYDVEISGPPVERLRALAGEATPFRLLLVALALAVSRWTGQARFALRVVGDLRTTRPMPDMVGNLVCTDLVAMDVPPQPDIRALLDQAGAANRTATQLRCPNLLGLPDSERFPDVSDLGIGTRAAVTLNYMPLYKLRGDEAPTPAAPGAYAPPVATRSAQTEYWPTPVCPVNLRIWDWGNRLVCRMEFDDDAITEADQHRLIDLFAQAVGDLPADPA